MKQDNLSLHQWQISTCPYMLTDSITNRRHLFSRKSNFRGEPYPWEGEEGDKEAGLLEDCGQMMPIIDRIVYQLEKENFPLLGKFLQVYYAMPLVKRGECVLWRRVTCEDALGKAEVSE